MRTTQSRSPRRLPAGALAAVLALFASLAATPADADAAVKPSLLQQLRDGGRVIACRHAATALAQPASRNSERVLSAAGREQARRLGEGIRRQRIPVAVALASPAQRSMQSARIAFGAAVRSAPALDGSDAAQRRLFTDDVAAGGNRVLVADEAAIRRALPGYGRAPLNEGDCLVVRPEHVQARIAPDGVGAHDQHAARAVKRDPGTGNDWPHTESAELTACTPLTPLTPCEAKSVQGIVLACVSLRLHAIRIGEVPTVETRRIAPLGRGTTVPVPLPPAGHVVGHLRDR